MSNGDKGSVQPLSEALTAGYLGVEEGGGRMLHETRRGGNFEGGTGLVGGRKKKRKEGGEKVEEINRAIDRGGKVDKGGS